MTQGYLATLFYKKSNYSPTTNDARAIESSDGSDETNDVHYGIIIAVFSWLTTTVETFRVDYVSLPWASE